MNSRQLLQRIRLWTPRYIYNRLRHAIYERRHPDHPWLNQNAIIVLSAYLQPHHRGLEFGSGRSTKWIAKRVGQLTSVESNRQWYEIVSQQLREENVGNVDYQFKGDEASYLSVAEQFEDEELDFVLVDGAFDRGDYALASISKVRPGGLLAVDNASWFIPSDSPSPLARRAQDGPASQQWAEFLERVASWQQFWTQNGLPYKDTVFYVREPVAEDFAGEMSSKGFVSQHPTVPPRRAGTQVDAVVG